jgi:DNA polymerase sigma
MNVSQFLSKFTKASQVIYCPIDCADCFDQILFIEKFCELTGDSFPQSRPSITAENQLSSFVEKMEQKRSSLLSLYPNCTTLSISVKNCNIENYKKYFSVSKEIYNAALSNTPWALFSLPLYVMQDDHFNVLSLEILDFYNFFQPTLCEHIYRRILIDEINKIIRKMYPKAILKVYGSLTSGSFLPSADIDISLFGIPDGVSTFLPFNSSPVSPTHLSNNSSLSSTSSLGIYLLNCSKKILKTYSPDVIKSCLGNLYQSLLSSKEFIPTAFIGNSAVPLVKLTHKESDVHIDISIGNYAGIMNSFILRQFFVKFPIARVLLSILKVFLVQNKLHEPFKGGMGSYLLSLILISHLQMYKLNFGVSFETESLGIFCLLFYFCFYF